MLLFGVVPFNFSLISFVLLTLCVCGTTSEDCSIRKTSSKLFCYYSKASDVNSCQCTHVVLPVDADVKAIEAVRSRLTDVKVLLTVNSFSESLITLLNATNVDGLDLRLTKLTSKDDIQDFVSTIRTKLNPELVLTLSVPARPELLAKYYDFKALSKHVDSFILETAFLGASGNVTFHPSRLSGVWDVQNTDSVVDLVTGLGAPLQKLVIAAPVQAFKFTLQDADHTAPGSPALELSTISRKELCDVMGKDKWMLERDQDQAGPYIFRDTTWIAFEDPTSIDIKSKYSRVRGLAGLALKDLSQDSPCSHELASLDSVSILEAAHSGLSKQSRAPRGALLQSLEREILAGGGKERLLDSVQVSPYRITRVVDTEGKVHAVRQDTRTEFECSRQGYFVHPRSCGRFYRCVKFDQLSDEYSVFEFDCPAGLVFDARVEVCVWPGSLPQASACSGSSEIAPVPRERFICPGEPGYFADPENCRWFFACLDHGKSPLSAYEFRCPFGLVFDQDRLLCEWPWLVPKCSSGFAEGAYEEYSYGGIGTGALAGSGYETTQDNGLSKTGLVLGHYNGLGSLNSVALGGLSGPLVQQVAKTYSSFNSGRDVGINGNVLDYKPIGTSVFGHGGHQARLNDFVDDSHLLNAQVNLYKIGDEQPIKDSDFDVDVRFNNYAEGSHQQLVNHNQQHNQIGQIQSTFDSLKLVPSTGASSYANLNQEHSSGGDKINIIGGGFSAVSSGVELSQHGSNFGHIEHVTPLPVEGSSTIATVTSVPVPFVQSSVGSVADFDIYQGGVVANVPNLQYKINPGAVNNLFNQQGGYSTASSLNKQSLNAFKGFVSSTTPVVPVAFVSSTPVTLHQAQVKFAGYNYEKPAVSFVEGASIAPPVVQLQKLDGYNYPKPSIPFVEEKPAVIATKEYLPPVAVTTVLPPVVVTKDYLPPVSVSTIQTPVIQAQQYLPPPKLVQPVTGQIYSYSHQNQVHTKVEQPVVQIQQSIGYEIPQVQIQKQPEFVQKYNTYSYGYQQPTIIRTEGYSYPKPTIKFEDIPKINQVFSYSQQPVVQGYTYPKPAIAFEEKPSAVSSQSFIKHNTYVRPVETTKLVQPLVPKVVVQENIGYAYPKPAVQFVEGPKQVINFEQKHQAISSQSFTQHVQQQPHIQVGYEYPKPQIKFEEKPLINQYLPAKVVQPVVQQGYAYPQPAIRFEEKPIVNTQYIQPVVPKLQQQTYIYQKPQVTQYVNPLFPKAISQGYSYPQQAVSSQSYVQHHSYVRPLETKVLQPIQPLKSQIVHPVSYGYAYPKPTIKFEEKPVLVQQQTFIAPQPQTVVHVQQENIGYAYPKPTIKFEEKPAVIQQTFVSPRPVVQPVVHVQENIGYSYPKPTIKFEEKPVVVQQSFVTPRPVVQPVVHVQQNIGYSYPKPTIKFEEKPVVVQQTFVSPRPVVQPVVHVQENIGYSYPKPTIKFEEKPVVVQKTFVTPRPVVQPVVHVQENIGYSYPKPTIKFEEKPVVVQQAFVTPRPVVQPVVHVQENIGYSYPKPTIKYEEKPAVIQQTFVTPKPVVYQQTSYIQPVKPVVHVPQHISYEYPKPAIKFEERPLQYVTPKPIVHVQQTVGYEYPKPAIKFEEKPVAIQQTFVTPRPVVHVQENIGYAYPRPTVKFEEKPLVVHQQTNYVKPVVAVQQTYLRPVQPVSTYSFPSIAAKQYIPPVTPVVQQQNVGYTYPKPAIKFEERPVHYNTYNYQNIEHKPVLQQQPVVYETKPIQPAVLPTYTYQQPRPFHVQAQQPAITQTYHYQPKPVVKQTVQLGYEYPKPQIRFEEKPVITYENRQPVQEEIIVPKKAYVTGYQHQKSKGYVYNKPAVAFEEVRYEAPRVTPRPTSVSTVASVVVPKIQQQNFYSYDSRFESRPQQVLVQPIVEQQKTVVESKPIFKYEFSSLDNSFNSYVAPPQKEYLPQVVSSTPAYVEPIVPVVSSVPRPKPVVVQQYSTPKVQILQEVQKTYVQSKPIAQYEFSSFDKEYKTYIAPPVVQKEYLPVQKTPKYIAPILESKPITQYEFNYYDSRFEPQKEFVQIKSTTPKFQINVPDLEYLPVRKVVTQPPRIYLPVSTTERIQPPRVYLPARTTEKVIVRTRKPTTTTERVITIPKETYLPVRTSTTENIPVTKPDRGYLPVAKPDREYLPVKTGKFIENYEAEEYENSDEVVSRRPIKVVKVVRPKSKSIVKVNDFHPILSAKLGAQCTCTSNTLRLRKPTKKIAVEIEEPDTRISDLEEYIKDDNESGDIIIEDYQYEPQKLQDQEIAVTRSPDVIVKSTTEELYSNAPAPNLVIKKRLRARPTSTTASYEDLPVSKVSDIFIRRSNRPRTKQIVIVDDTDEPNNEEIADAVKTSLKLVKSAVKEGVKEGIRESSIEGKTFDRFGPGGVRSRGETLQGTIDCQRAGLFRHPTHCNKFYACRWDCKKNRFTLHVFNCPVHLTFDNNLGACNWPSQGPACVDNTLLPNE